MAEQRQRMVVDRGGRPVRAAISLLRLPLRASQPTDMWHKVKLATWNVMSLSETGYQTALACELSKDPGK